MKLLCFCIYLRQASFLCSSTNFSRVSLQHSSVLFTMLLILSPSITCNEKTKLHITKKPSDEHQWHLKYDRHDFQLPILFTLIPGNVILNSFKILLWDGTCTMYFPVTLSLLSTSHLPLSNKNYPLSTLIWNFLTYHHPNKLKNELKTSSHLLLTAWLS